MDPLTQGIVGAAAAQLRSRPAQLAKFAVIGALSGMAADLDVLIQSADDPLLALEYHRHFSHSLIFIPLGALLCTLVLYPLIARRWQMNLRQIYIPAVIGYATHGLLDTCTTYGTQLFWPFSDYRASIDVISVIDPLFTLPVLVLMIIALVKRSKRFVHLSLLWGTLYLILGYVQQQRAETMGWELAAARDHHPQRLEAKPSFGNIAVWKVLYEYEQTFYVDAVRPGVTDRKIWQGDSIPALDTQRDLSWLNADSQQAKDIERFRWFSAGFIAVYPPGSNRVVDIRYSLLPDEIEPLWGIQLSPGAPADQHAEYIVTRGDGRRAFAPLWRMITGTK